MMNKLRVLVVDDERMIADSLCLIFQKYGFEAQAVYSADDGIDCARSFLPQLLLTDLSMPGMSGLVMASTIVSALPACCVLMLTGDYRALEEACSIGTSLFRKHSLLIKPVHPEVLLQEAHHLLNASRPALSSALPIQ